jgi:hypothetical protein
MTKGVDLRESRDSNMLNAEVSISTDITILLTVFIYKAYSTGYQPVF